jgi:hypothetical protein
MRRLANALVGVGHINGDEGLAYGTFVAGREETTCVGGADSRFIGEFTCCQLVVPRS